MGRLAGDGLVSCAERLVVRYADWWIGGLVIGGLVDWWIGGLVTDQRKHSAIGRVFCLVYVGSWLNK